MLDLITLVFGVITASALGIIASRRIASHAVGKLSATAVLVVILYGVAENLLYNQAFSTGGYPIAPQFGVYLSFNYGAIPMMLALLTAIVVLAAELSMDAFRHGGRGAHLLLMLFEAASIGLFTANNLLLFFLFWDMGIISMFFVISSFGSPMGRAAAMKFLVYSLASSAMLLLAILAIYSYSVPHTLEISYVGIAATSIPHSIQLLIFALMLAAFMIKMPIFPLHSWMRGAYSEAPTYGSMLIAGILSKYGAYGMLILFALLPIAHEFAIPVMLMATLSVFYSAFAMIRQNDIKGMLAYASMAEMGVLLIGIASMTVLGTYGAAYGMLAHGLSVSLLFLAAAFMEQMFGSRMISSMRGVVEGSAVTAYVFLLGIFASVGLPLTAGFVADLLIFTGAYGSFGLYGLTSLLGIALVAGYFYFVVSQAVISPKAAAVNAIRIPVPRQMLGCALLVFFIFLFGMLPSILLRPI